MANHGLSPLTLFLENIMPSHNRSEAIKASKSRSKAKSARVIKAGQKQAPTTGARVVRKKR